MLISKSGLIAVIKSYFPNADIEVYGRIADEVIRDAEAAIHSMVRQEVAQERQALYKNQDR